MVITVLTYDTAVCASPNGLPSSPYAPNASTVLTCTSWHGLPSEATDPSVRDRQSAMPSAHSASKASAVRTSPTGAYSISHTSPAYVPCAFSTRPIRTARSPHHQPTPSTLFLCAMVCVLHRARYSLTGTVPSIVSRSLRSTTTWRSADELSLLALDSGWSTRTHVKTSSATPWAVRETNIPSSALTFLRRATTSAVHLWTRESVGFSSERTASERAR
mmetsp:Transcript_10836/g.30286  ORF Transcript_10836/g.30286 Transcript_10836/m.30286 type:complete len:218 (+) Transcript_10836:93-746(+)